LKRWRVKKYSGEYDFDPDEYYEHRINFHRAKLPKLVNSGKINDAKADRIIRREEQNHAAYIAEMSDQEKMNGDVAVVIPTYVSHKPWLKACLESVKRLGFYILLAYDNHFYKKSRGSEVFPNHKVMMLADAVVMKPVNHFQSVGIAHMWNMWHNLKLLHGFGFPYVLSIAGDCILERPEGFEELFAILGKNNIICNMWDNDRRYAGTLGVLAKTEVYLDYFEHFVRNQYDRSGSTEGRLYRFLLDSPEDYAVAAVKNSAHNFKMPDPNSTWNKTIGYRHLHAEQMIRQESRYLPVERKYFDFGDNNENIKVGGPLWNYYNTGDVKYLESWWKWGRD